MKKLIDANALKAEFDRHKNVSEDIYRILFAQEAVDAVEVVHAHWEMLHKTHGVDEDSDYDWRCSECGHVDCHNINVEVPFCWYCGAKMDAPTQKSVGNALEALDEAEEDGNS